LSISATLGVYGLAALVELQTQAEHNCTGRSINPRLVRQIGPLGPGRREEKGDQRVPGGLNKEHGCKQDGSEPREKDAGRKAANTLA
jgi:hypothetical protein